MEIKSKNINVFLIFYISFTFTFTFIGSAILLTIGNSYQVVFSQGYIPPPSNNSKSQSFLCSQIAFSGPSYTGPDGCPTPCPTTNGDNIPKGCPTPSSSTSTLKGSSTTNAPTLHYPVTPITSPNSTSPSQYVSAVDGKCPAGSHEVGGSSGNAGQPGTGSIICRLDNPSVTPPPATIPTNTPLTTATQNTVLNTVNKQTCPPLPIDANGRCPGIDMRGGGLGLPPVPPPPPPPPPPPAQVPSETKKPECIGEVYFDIHSNKCVSADVPKSDGNCVTGYEKSTADSTLCEPINFHCPAGTHVSGYSDERGKGDCINNDRPLPSAGDSPPICIPGWHYIASYFATCERD